MHNLLKQANKAVAKCLLDLIEIAAKIVSDNKILILQKTEEHKKKYSCTKSENNQSYHDQ